MDWEDPQEEGMTTHSSILAWRIPWTEEPGRPQSMRLPEGREEASHAVMEYVYVCARVHIHSWLWGSQEKVILSAKSMN